MSTPFFDDFWEASSLDEFSVRPFAERMNKFDADVKLLQLEYPEEATPLNLNVSRLSKIAGKRKSDRSFNKKPLSQKQIATILGAGMTVDGLEHRAYPAAGAQYSAELFQVIFNGEDLTGKIVYYDAEAHGYVRLPQDAPSWDEAKDRLNIEVSGMPQSLVLIVTFPDRVTEKYGERGGRFALLEAGALMQQLSLTVAATKQLKGVVVGGVFDEYWKDILGLSETTAHVAVGYLVGK
jgi:SagB-type dehydrogenase family enzyme